MEHNSNVKYVGSAFIGILLKKVMVFLLNSGNCLYNMLLWTYLLAYKWLFFTFWVDCGIVLLNVNPFVHC